MLNEAFLHLGRTKTRATELRLFPLGAADWRVVNDTLDCEDCGVLSLLRLKLHHSKSEFIYK